MQIPPSAVAVVIPWPGIDEWRPITAASNIKAE
jgi:hypothetical protein